MKTILQISCVMIFMSAPIKVLTQVTLPYFTGFDNAAQKNGWTFYQKAGMGTGWIYTTAATKIYSAPSALWQIYSPSNDIDDWFVSPDFSIPGGGKIDSLRFMNNGLMTPTVDDTVAVYLLQGSQDPSLAVKTILFNIRGADFVNDGVYRKKTNIILSPYPGNSYVAFRFKCKQFDWLEPYFDNLAISSSASAPVASFSLIAANVCKGKALSLKNQSTNNPTSWNWQIPGGTPASSTSSSVTVSFAKAGIYTITLVSSNSVGPSAAVSKTIEVSPCTGLDGLQFQDTEATIYPNPSSSGSFITLKMSSEILDAELYLQVFNLLGELVFHKKVSNSLLNQIYPDLQSGSYIYRLRNKERILKSGNLIVE